MSYSLNISLADQAASCGAPAVDPVTVKCGAGTKLYLYATNPAYTATAGPCGTDTYGPVAGGYTQVIDLSGQALTKLATNTWAIENLTGSWSTSSFARLVGSLLVDQDGSGTGYAVTVDVIKQIMNLWMSTLRTTISINGVVSVDNRALPPASGTASFTLAGYAFSYGVAATTINGVVYPALSVGVVPPSGGSPVPLVFMYELVPQGVFIQAADGPGGSVYGYSGPSAAAGVVSDGVLHNTISPAAGSNVFPPYYLSALGFAPSTSFGFGYSCQSTYGLPATMFSKVPLIANPT